MVDSEKNGSTIKARRKVYAGKHLDFRVDSNGWEYVVRVNGSIGVVIVPITMQNELVFVEQYRSPVDCNVVSFPAGLTDVVDFSKKDGVTETARRELLEETGFDSSDIEVILSGPVLPGLTNEINTFCLIRGAVRNSSGDRAIYGLVSEKERTIVHVVPLKKTTSWLHDQRLAANKLIDIKVYAGLFFVLSEMGLVKKNPRL